MMNILWSKNKEQGRLSGEKVGVGRTTKVQVSCEASFQEEVILTKAIIFSIMISLRKKPNHDVFLN